MHVPVHVDTEKSRRIQMLEESVAELEAALQLQADATSGPPPIPPRGLPPSPKLMDAAGRCGVCGV